MTDIVISNDWEDAPTLPGRQLDPVVAIPNDPSLLDSEGTARYLDAPYPCEVDEVVERALAVFESSDERGRHRIVHAPLAAGQAWVILRYAERMALLGFCSGEARFQRQGLTALELIGNRVSPSRIAPLRLMLHRAAAAAF
jgi:hypothetical protein